jgi:hypothetical protein
MKRALFISILVGLLGLGWGDLSTASAQVSVDEEPEYWEDEGTTGEYLGDESQAGSAGSASLDEARQSGIGVRLGGGSLAPRQVPERYTVRRGDTLWDITGHFYGNPWQWPRVWSYNPEITNPHWIYPDDTLRLVPEGSAEVRLPDGGGDGGDRIRVTEGALQPGSIFLRDQGYLDPEALKTFGEIVGSPEDHMLLTTYDEVYVQFGDEAEGVRRGMELSVFRRIDADDRSPEEQGELVRIFGTINLRSYDPETKVGRGSITEAMDPIERGFEVANIPRRFEMVPPRENDSDVDAEVVAALRPLQMFGNHQIVFVNAGEGQGLKLGNRFFIVRSGDEWRDNLTTSEREAGASDVSDDPTEYPDEIVAEARVVNVRPDTAALMVTRAIAEIEIGDRAEMRRGY